ncbi:MAG: ADOP family duplicated permease [Gemmatimonadaceae bacterium]
MRIPSDDQRSVDRSSKSTWVHDGGIASWMDAALGDARFALRALGRRPALAIGIVFTLALAIGVTVAAFGIVNAVLLAKLPVREQDALVVLRMHDATRPSSAGPVALTNGFLDTLRGRAPAFSSLARVFSAGATPFAARYRDRLTTLSTTAVGGEMFEVLGVRSALGRLMRPSDDSAGSVPPVVLSYHAWRSTFGADSQAVGRILAVQGMQARIIGVAAPGFDYPEGTDAWVSLEQMERPYGDDRSPNGGYFDLVGRLRAGATPGQAQAQFAAVARSYKSSAMGDAASRVVALESYAEAVTGKTRTVLLVVSVAVLLVLCVACVNVAGLLLARGVERTPELAVRAAIGASRGRIVGQLLAESAMLAGLGGVAGTAIGAGLLRLGVGLAPADWPRLDQVHFDGTVVAFAIAVTAVAVLLFGVAPALSIAVPHLERELRSSGVRVSADRRTGRLRRAVVVVQVALAVVILAGAGLVARSLAHIDDIDLGFTPRQQLIAGLELMVPPVTDTAQSARYGARFRTLVNEALQRLAATPGVVGVTTTAVEPFSDIGLTSHYLAEGQPPDAASHNAMVDWDIAAPDYFQALGMRLERGRLIGAQDTPNGAPVAVVSEALARAAWPARNPIGQRLSLGLSNVNRKWYTVIGVVADTRFRGLTVDPRPSIYLSSSGRSLVGVWLTVRTRGDPRAMLPALTRIVRSIDPDAGIRKVETGAALLSAQTARSRALATTLGILAGTVLLLAALGVFALLATLVRGRTHEIGVRMALGASDKNIRSLIIAHAVRMGGAGAGIGLLLALAGTRVLRAQLYQVSATDPLTMGAVVVVLLAAVLVAAYLPARRAVRVDPLVALRSE